MLWRCIVNYEIETLLAGLYSLKSVTLNNYNRKRTPEAINIQNLCLNAN